MRTMTPEACHCYEVRQSACVTRGTPERLCDWNRLFVLVGGSGKPAWAVNEDLPGEAHRASSAACSSEARSSHIRPPPGRMARILGAVTRRRGACPSE